jgi:hypothetical protein
MVTTAPLFRILALLLTGSIAAPAAALTYNPIDPALPLNIHARATCLDGPVSAVMVKTDDDPRFATCAGAVIAEDPIVLTYLPSSGDAEADLREGTFKSVAIGRSYSDATSNLRANMVTDQYLYDVLTVNGDWTGTRNIELRVVVDGSATTNAITPNWMQSSIQGSLVGYAGNSPNPFGLTHLIITVGNNGAPGISSSEAIGNASFTTNAAGHIFDPDDMQFTLSIVFPATTANRTFTFIARLRLASGMGFGTGIFGITDGVLDFDNTGQFSLVVPDDVTVSSASGDFLSGGSTDTDGDGISNASDNCPTFANAQQLDGDSNGRGDDCECGDQDGNGRVNVSDLIAINLAIFNPGLATPLCDANGDGLCNVADIVAANRTIYVPRSSTCARQPVPGP